MSTSDFYALNQVKSSHLNQSKNELPLVLSPLHDNTLDFICKWVERNRSWVDQQILRYGAVLIRGFQISSALDFERATLTLQPHLSDQYRGTSPRSLAEGTQYSFSAADVPVNYPIAQHLEMSFLNAPPRHLYFGCLKESKAAGGETSLCDFRKVYQDLPPQLREKFASKKIKYTRTHSKRGERFTYDVGAMVSWIELFDTSDEKEVEAICEEEDAPEINWVGPNQDTFYQEWTDDPFQIHPDTGDHVWFNHSQVFHWTTFPSELWFSFRRVRDIRLLIHCLLVSIFNFVVYCLLGYEMALNTTFGDGSPISFQEMNVIRHAIHKNMVFSRWEKGDILCIDNFSTSHGRQPTYDKGRKVIVGWSQPRMKASYSDLKVQPSLTTDTTSEPPISANAFDILPDLSAATPGSTPESTLTEDEATKHRAAILETQGRTLSDRETPHQSQVDSHKRHASCPTVLAANSEFWKKFQ